MGKMFPDTGNNILNFRNKQGGDFKTGAKYHQGWEKGEGKRRANDSRINALAVNGPDDAGQGKTKKHRSSKHSHGIVKKSGDAEHLEQCADTQA